MGLFNNTFWKEKRSQRRVATVFDGRPLRPSPGSPEACCSSVGTDACCSNRLLQQQPYFNSGGHLWRKRRLKPIV